MRVFFHCPDNFGQAHYRAVLPYVNLYSDLLSHGIELVQSTELSVDDYQFDAYIFHRLITTAQREFIYAVTQRRQPARIVWATDDNVWQIDPDNPAYPIYGEPERVLINQTIDDSFAVHVSTSELAKRVCYHPNVHILPNLLTPTAFTRPPVSNDTIRILWAGSSSHDSDVNLIAEPLIQIAMDFPNVQVCWWGYLPGACAYAHRQAGYDHAIVRLRPDLERNMIYLPGKPFNRYFHTLSQIQPTIALCPLVDTPFSQCRSNLKHSEMTLAGAACICSDLPPYENCHAKKVTDATGWYDAIAELICSPERRQQLQSAAYDQVMTERTWTSPARQDWLAALLQLSDHSDHSHA